MPAQRGVRAADPGRRNRGCSRAGPRDERGGRCRRRGVGGRGPPCTAGGRAVPARGLSELGIVRRVSSAPVRVLPTPSPSCRCGGEAGPRHSGRGFEGAGSGSLLGRADLVGRYFLIVSGERGRGDTHRDLSYPAGIAGCAHLAEPLGDYTERQEPLVELARETGGLSNLSRRAVVPGRRWRPDCA